MRFTGDISPKSRATPKDESHWHALWLGAGNRLEGPAGSERAYMASRSRDRSERSGSVDRSGAGSELARASKRCRSRVGAGAANKSIVRGRARAVALGTG